ncbi:MAG: class A beta-lactamase [Acidobacteria bacterium]|nr:class A beta-lactamase [Acidobacteriota bacterium]
MKSRQPFLPAIRSIATALAISLCALAPALRAQSHLTPLQQQIRSIAAHAHGSVSVACSLPHTTLNCDLDPHAHPPMQSVFKLPLALLVLHRVEQHKLALDQPIRFLPSDRILPHAYSPLQDHYPAANVDIPLRELLRLTVSLSDNTAADILLRLVGGPPAVNRYMASLGITGFHLQDNENALHHSIPAQYNNWFEPSAAVHLLRRIADNSPLTPAHTALLLRWMQPSGITNRLQSDLPPGTAVAHKSGTSDVDNGIAHATNDIGLITLPSGQRLAIAVFITDATADQATREHVIAAIARAAYDASLISSNSPK